MKISHLIPFRLKPGSIGLKGKAYDIAAAYHDYDGEDLDRRLAEIDAGDDLLQLRSAMIAIDVKYKRKTQFEADCEMANLDLKNQNLNTEEEIKLIEIKLKHHMGDPYASERRLAELKHPNEEDRELALLDIERSYEKVSELEYEKQSATIKNEPWIAVVDHKFNPIEGINGLSIEFDWNEQWIRFLRANGYTGIDDGDVVDRWFQDINQSYTENDNEFAFVANGPTTRRFDNGDGSASYV